jgi:hypothetical protein
MRNDGLGGQPQACRLTRCRRFFEAPENLGMNQVSLPPADWLKSFRSLRQDFTEASRAHLQLDHVVLKRGSKSALLACQDHKSMERLAGRLLNGQSLERLILAIGNGGPECEIFYIWGPNEAVERFGRLAHIAGNCLPKELSPTQTIFPFSKKPQIARDGSCRWIYFLFATLSVHPGTLVCRQIPSDHDEQEGDIETREPLARITINLFDASVQAIDMIELRDNKPNWDGTTLLYCGKILKEYTRNPAANQRKLLAAFQAAGWPSSILNPFYNPNAQTAETKSYKTGVIGKLNKTIEALNKCSTTIRFTTNGDNHCKWSFIGTA